MEGFESPLRNYIIHLEPHDVEAIVYNYETKKFHSAHYLTK